MIKIIKIRIVTVFLVAMLGFMGFVPSYAQDTPCDPEYFDSLKSRAWLEAQREITQNQNLIFKPDSVFEYTCFDLFVSELADHAKDMFSETQRWGAIPGIDINSMDDALNAVVGDALREYIDQNFEDDRDGDPYGLLGGRLPPEVDHDLPVAPDPVIQGDASGGTGTYQGVAYACDIMNQVWMAAKCMNFIDNETNDGFFTFEEYRDQDDKRFLPSQCAGIPQRWAYNIERAITDTPWEEDDVETFLERLNPDNCRSSTPVPTGVTVYRKESPSEYLEYVCILPGCYYDPTRTLSDGSLAPVADRCTTSP